MDWQSAVAKNRDDLLKIVTRLFVMTGIRTGRSVIALPRQLRLRILGLLRPAEFAARRLIAVAACKLVVKAYTGHVELSEADVARSAAKRQKSQVRGTLPSSAPAFPLFDPFKPFSHPWLEDGENGRAEMRHTPETSLGPDDPVDARALCRRVVALERALQDIEGQAARLARWRARRSAESPSCPGPTRVKPKRFSPLRPGRPPGWCKRPKTALEEVLKECDFLARDAWNTS